MQNAKPINRVFNVCLAVVSLQPFTPTKLKAVAQNLRAGGLGPRA